MGVAMTAEYTAVGALPGPNLCPQMKDRWLACPLGAQCTLLAPAVALPAALRQLFSCPAPATQRRTCGFSVAHDPALGLQMVPKWVLSTCDFAIALSCESWCIHANMIGSQMFTT